MQLVLEGLVHIYPSGQRALDGVSLTVPQGTRMALLGANGAGKSTLVRHWNGLLRPSIGRVLFDSVDAGTLSPAAMAAQVAYLFQNPDDQLFARSLREEVGFGPRQQGLHGARLQAVADEALDAVGLLGQVHVHPFDLDYSRRKLLALACVLAMNTPILALDEPTANLDSSTIERISTALQARPRTTIVAITHDLDWAAESFERFVVMDAGRVVADGRGEEVLTERWPALDVPSIPYLAAGLGLPPTVTRHARFVAAYQEGNQATGLK